MARFRTVLGGCPLDCPDTCSWVVTVDDDTGRAVKLRGNPEHPFTQGGLCPKVNPWLEHAADPGRLLRPLRRVGAKGEGRFEPVSWSDALAEMAERLTAVIDRHGGPDGGGGAAVWPFVGTGNLGWIQGSNGRGRIWNRMGASEHHLSICSVAGHAGIVSTAGTGGGLDAEDFAHAGLVLIWGSNTLVTNRHLWPFVQQARRAGARLVVVDPVRTRTAEAADAHLALRPGTDGALALGLCRAIVDAGGADEAFLTGRCLGWPEFEASLREWTPERTEAVTGVAAADVEALARAIVAAPPLAVRIGHGIQRQAHGGQAMRVVSCLPAVTGAYDRPGGGSLYSSTGSYKGYNIAKARAAHLGPGRPRTLTMTRLGEHLTATQDPPVDALVIYGANPMVSNPGLGLVRQGLARDDLFTVVIDVFPTETVAYADLVLPSTMQHEQTELNDSYNHWYLNWNNPAVAPPGECLPHAEIWRRLARAMGYTEPELFASDEEIAADLLDSPVFAEAGVTVETLQERGFVRNPLSDPEHRPFRPRFPTPSGRFELVSAWAEEAGHGRVPNYRPPREAASGPDGTLASDGTLALIAAASEHHVNSVFAGNAVVAARTGPGDPPLLLHPDDAAPRGLVTGSRVRVANERGWFEAVVEVSSRTRPGVAATTKGRWGVGLNRTVAERSADMADGAVFHDNRVTVEPC